MTFISNDDLQGLTNLESKLDLINQGLIKIISNSKKVTGALDFKKTDDFTILEKEIDQVTRAEIELIAIEKQKKQLSVEVQRAEKARIQTLREKQRLDVQTQREAEKVAKATEKVQRAQEKANSAFLKATKRLNDMRREYKDLVFSGKGATKSTIALRNEINKLDRSVKKAEADVGQFQRRVGEYKSALAGSLGTVGQFATGAGAIAAGVLLAGKAIGSAVNIIKDFEQAGANLAAVLGDLATDDNIGKLADDAKRLGASTAFSATEVRGLQTEFAKLGFSPEAIVNATEATLNLAAATGSDLAEAAAIAGATLGGFGLEASETQRVTDVMAKSFSTSALDIEKFRESMKTAAPAAKAVGLNVETTTALLGTLANAGISGSKAGSSLATSFINLNTKGLTLQKGLEKVSKSTNKLQTAVDLVGKEAAKAFLILADGTEATELLEQGLNNAGGAAERMANVQLDTLDGAIKILNSSWEGFILALDDVVDSSTVMTTAVKVLSNVLSTLSGQTKEVKKSQSELTDENLRLLKSTRENTQENEKLANRYDELTGKVELNADEKNELISITTQLIDRFGESVVVINQETGALEVNIRAVRKKILADKVLESETTKNLIVEKARLETAIELAKNAQSQVQALRESIDISELDFGAGRIFEVIDAIEKGPAAVATAAAKITGELAASTSGSLNELKAFEKILELIAPQINRLSGAVFSLNTNQKDLIKINEEFKALGIDIDEFLENETEAFNSNTSAVNSNKKARRELTGLIELQQKALKDLQDQRKQTTSEEDIARLSSEIREAQAELKRLQNLGLEALEEVPDRLEVTLDIGANLEPFKSDIFDFVTDANKVIADANKEAEEDVRKSFERRLSIIGKSLDEAAQAQREAHKERLNEFDEEIKASRDLQKSLAEDARRGVASAKNNLVFARQEERKAQLDRAEEVKRQKRIEEGLVFLKLLASNASDPNDKNPVLTTISEFAAAKLAIAALTGFFTGADNVAESLGKPTVSGRDGYAIRVDGNEMILNPDETAELRSKGITTRDGIFDVIEQNEQFKLRQLVDVDKTHQALHVTNMYENNGQMLSKMDDLIESNNNAYKKIKQTNWSLDALGRLMKDYQDGNGKRTIDIYEKGSIF